MCVHIQFSRIVCGFIQFVTAATVAIAAAVLLLLLVMCTAIRSFRAAQMKWRPFQNRATRTPNVCVIVCTQMYMSVCVCVWHDLILFVSLCLDFRSVGGTFCLRTPHYPVQIPIIHHFEYFRVNYAILGFVSMNKLLLIASLMEFSTSPPQAAPPPLPLKLMTHRKSYPFSACAHAPCPTDKKAHIT